MPIQFFNPEEFSKNENKIIAQGVSPYLIKELKLAAKQIIEESPPCRQCH